MVDKKDTTKDNNKMGLWDQVCRTNPDHTKKMTHGAKLTAINAQAQRKMATKMFGPYGIGWGVKNQSYTVIGTIEELKKGIILYKADFFYHWEGVSGEFPISSSITMVSEAGPSNNRYTTLDDECIKKVTTDALTKGLSFLGFNSDIHEGLWDDNRYVAELKEEFGCNDKKKQQSKSKPKQQPKPKPKQAKVESIGFTKRAGAIKKEIGNVEFMAVLGSMGFTVLDEMTSEVDQKKFMKHLANQDLKCDTTGDVKLLYCFTKCGHYSGETGFCNRWGNKMNKG